VIGSDFRAVIGVIVQNLHRDLSPSRVVTSYSEDGQVIEETRYQVPSGLAVQRTYIRARGGNAGVRLIRIACGDPLG
jgi:hypothetical protein